MTDELFEVIAGKERMATLLRTQADGLDRSRRHTAAIQKRKEAKALEDEAARLRRTR